ncbi:hypothetical protein FGRMN_9746 [Fusarium graminum]|nr:hypothetical protein FGRMN_9746 [Fusarium graminum]
MTVAESMNEIEYKNKDNDEHNGITDNNFPVTQHNGVQNVSPSVDEDLVLAIKDSNIPWSSCLQAVSMCEAFERLTLMNDPPYPLGTRVEIKRRLERGEAMMNEECLNDYRKHPIWLNRCQRGDAWPTTMEQAYHSASAIWFILCNIYNRSGSIFDEGQKELTMRYNDFASRREPLPKNGRKPMYEPYVIRYMMEECPWVKFITLKPTEAQVLDVPGEDLEHDYSSLRI